MENNFGAEVGHDDQHLFSYPLYMICWGWIAYFHVLFRFWPLTFIKFYSTCFQAISLDMQKYCWADNSKLEVYSKLDSYFEMINRIECEIGNFNGHFQWILIAEVLFCIWKILIYSFFTGLFLFNALNKSSFAPVHISKLFPIVLYGKQLYDFCSASTDLLVRMRKVAEDLEEISTICDVELKERYRDKVKEQLKKTLGIV